MSDGPRELPRVFGQCYICGDAANSPGNVAVIMTNPDGSIQGLVCGGCLIDGSYLTHVGEALLGLRQGDTPRG